MHDKIAHTAEHAFIGSLQRLLGQTLLVRKVEHKSSGNTAFIVIENLDLQTVLRAEAEVNSLIEQGRRVTELDFESLEEARKALPGLRANEERISGQVRVVEIKGHDIAACAMEHAKDVQECDFFLVTRLSKAGDEYEIDFVVARQAKEMAVSLSARLLSVCSELGANINTVENTARKLKAENDSNRGKLRSLGLEKLEAIAAKKIGRFTFFGGSFANLDDDQLVEFAAEKIATSQDLLVFLANVGAESARIVFARNEKLSDIDCNAIFKLVGGIDGRGGGKPHFVTGVVKNDSVARVSDGIAQEITKLS